MSVTDVNGCVGSETVVVLGTTEISAALAGFKMYPNPVSKGVLSITTGDIQEIKIIDITGKLIQSIQVSKRNLQVDVSQLNSGMYFVKGTLHGDKYITKKLVIE